MTLGIDISNNNGAVDLAAVKADPAGYRVVVIKASQDTADGGFRDPDFAGSWAAARTQGFVRLAYHMTDPRFASPVQSVGLLQEMLTGVGGLEAGDGVAIDVELGTTDLVWLAETLDLASRVFGLLVWKYSGSWYTASQGLENAGIARYPTWFVGAPGDREREGWSPVRMWQTTVPAGVVAGVAGPCDVDTFLGSVEELRALGSPTGWTPPSPWDIRAELGQLDAAAARWEAAGYPVMGQGIRALAGLRRGEK